MSDDFSQYPTSIATAKANKSGNAKDWTPRDCVIEFLRLLDKGEIDPQGLIISYWKDSGEGVVCSFIACSPNILVSMGALERVKQMLVSI